MMNTLEQTLELAQISLGAENYEEAYQKFTNVLDGDFRNSTAWLGKGLASAFISNIKSIKFKESQTSINKSFELGYTGLSKTKIADMLLDASLFFIKKINSSAAEILMHKANKPMATGQLYAVKKFGDIVDRYETFNKHWEYYLTSLEFMDYVITLDSTSEILEKKLTIVDYIYAETEGHFHEDHLKILETYRDGVVENIKICNPKFSPNPLPKKSGACFIATAIYGNYNHEKVLTLRAFRDNYLETNLFGSLLVRLYYKYSPTLTIKLENKPRARRFIQLFILDNLVRIVLGISKVNHLKYKFNIYNKI